MSNAKLNHHHVWLPRDGAARTVVALHGTGGDENDLVPLVREISPDANILGVRGNVVEHGYPRFFKRFAEGVFDEADVRVRAAELEAFWEAAREEYGLTKEATTWLGYSNGANMIAAMLMLSGDIGDVVGDAVLLRAQAPFKDSGTLEKGVPAKVRLVTGSYDTIVPVTESARLRDELQARGHTVEQVLLETGHQLSRMDLEALQ